MSSIGPFQISDTIRIPLEVTINGKPISVVNPRVQRVILPDKSDALGYPKQMLTIKPGTYMLETTFDKLGNYIAILQAELGNETIEQIAEFIIEKPYGLPRIEIACDY